MYNDVVRVADAGPAAAAAGAPLRGVQDYKANNNAAVHLRAREPPKTKSPAAFAARCGGCDRAMQPEFVWCSIECRLAAPARAAGSGTLTPVAGERRARAGAPVGASEDEAEAAAAEAEAAARVAAAAARRAGRRAAAAAAAAAAAVPPPPPAHRRKASPQRSPLA
jgi:hypothetical protein